MVLVILPRNTFALYLAKALQYFDINSGNIAATICMISAASRGQMSQYIAMPSVSSLLPKRDASSFVVTRFAPSPNGNLHLGHALSAIAAHDFARAHGGRFLLRIEDIDGTRSRPEYSAAIIADLAWLGLKWDGDIVYQSQRLGRYQAALDVLKAFGLIYPCACTRSDITAALRGRRVAHGPDGPIYSGTCRGADIPKDTPIAWRLNMRAAIEQTGSDLRWTDAAAGQQAGDPALFGDIVLWRKDAPASYHLAATVDDGTDGVTYVVRGKDLFAYTAIHILLQKLLGLMQPLYWHHDLLIGENGGKLSKSKQSPALAALREAGDDGRKLADAVRLGKLPLGISVMSG
jgi:glutamyl-Q tRNA(Asp) synthetase